MNENSKKMLHYKRDMQMKYGIDPTFITLGTIQSIGVDLDALAEECGGYAPACVGSKFLGMEITTKIPGLVGPGYPHDLVRL